MARGCVAVALTVVLFVSAGAGAAPARTCGDVPVAVTQGGATTVLIARGRPSCATARRVIVAAVQAEHTRHRDGFDRYRGQIWRVRGWRCSVYHGGTDCTRGRQGILGQYHA